MRLGKKNSTNLEQLDYLEDLNRLLFSNVVDQAAQKTEYYLAYYIGGREGGRRGGVNKPAAAAKSLAYISLLQHLDACFLQLMSTDMSLMDLMIQMRSEGIFTRAL